MVRWQHLHDFGRRWISTSTQLPVAYGGLYFGALSPPQKKRSFKAATAQKLRGEEFDRPSEAEDKPTAECHLCHKEQHTVGLLDISSMV